MGNQIQKCKEEDGLSNIELNKLEWTLPVQVDPQVPEIRSVYSVNHGVVQRAVQRAVQRLAQDQKLDQDQKSDQGQNPDPDQRPDRDRRDQDQNLARRVKLDQM